MVWPNQPKAYTMIDYRTFIILIIGRNAFDSSPIILIKVSTKMRRRNLIPPFPLSPSPLFSKEISNCFEKIYEMNTFKANLGLKGTT